MKMTNMKMPPKDDELCKGESPIAVSEPRYPYGLEISLNTDSMDKLGLDSSDFSVGETVNIIAKARITNLSASERAKSSGGTEQNQSMSLQITDIALNNPNSFNNSFDEFAKKKSS